MRGRNTLLHHLQAGSTLALSSWVLPPLALPPLLEDCLALRGKNHARPTLMMLWPSQTWTRIQIRLPILRTPQRNQPRSNERCPPASLESPESLMQRKTSSALRRRATMSLTHTSVGKMRRRKQQGRIVYVAIWMTTVTSRRPDCGRAPSVAGELVYLARRIDKVMSIDRQVNKLKLGIDTA
jgi:hypothetical protein